MAAPDLPSDIRWEQRFENFNKALTLLDGAFAIPLEQHPELSKEGIVQRFEFTFELAWNVMKDFLQFSGIAIDPPIAPRNVIKAAFAADLIQAGQEWIDMMELRNKLSHNYSMDMFGESLPKIYTIYWPLLQSLREKLLPQLRA